MNPKMTVRSKTCPSDDEVGSILPSVPTKARQASRSVKIDIRVDQWLKAAAQTKAERHRSNLTEVLTAALADYVAGNLRVKDRRDASKRSYEASMAYFRRIMVANHNLIQDLRHWAQIDTASPLKGPGVAAMLAALLETNRQILSALSTRNAC
jgi:hypothetical protein